MESTNTSMNKEATMARSTLILDKDDGHLADRPETSNEVIGQGFYRLAKVYYDKADLKKAEEFFLKSLALSSYPRDCFGMFKIYGFLIRIHSEALNQVEAEKYINLSVELMEQTSRDLGSLNCEFFYNQGMLKTYKGAYSEALEAFLMSSTKAEQDGDMGILSKSYFSLAHAYYQLGKYEEATKYLDKLERHIEDKHKDYLKATMHILLSNILTDQGEHEKAMGQLDRALVALKKKSCWNLLGQVLIAKGVNFRKTGDFSKSIMFFDMAKNILDENYFKRSYQRLENEIVEASGSSIDVYLDRHNKIIFERDLGQIDFKHRFVLLEILFLLARHSGECFDKDQLARKIWKDEYNPLIHDKLIYTSISRLRKLIEPKSGKRKYILRRKDGYTFNPRIVARFIGENELKQNPKIGNVDLASPV